MRRSKTLRDSLLPLPLLALGLALLPLDSARAQIKTSVIRQHGITWTFSATVSAGQYVNGDWWVIGPVTVKSVSPAPGGGRNQSMKNPPCGSQRWQAYDDRIPMYDKSKAALFPLKLVAGDCVVSTKSRIGSKLVKHIYLPAAQGQGSLSPLETAAILTCVPKAQDPFNFRPAYAGKKLSFNARLLRWDRLPRLPKLASSPGPLKVARYFERPWLDHLQGWTGRYLHPYQNMPDYGRDIALCAGEGALVLLEDYSWNELWPLMVRFVQLGIDNYGLLQGGQYWPAEGGHGNGRKWPIIFAGLMLDDAGMQRPGHAFSEDQQTYFDYGWTGSHSLFRRHLNNDFERKTPAKWDSDNVKSETYRRCCTSGSFVPAALAAHLMRATELWKHAPYFHYVERWMTPMNSKDRSTARARVGSLVDSFPQGGAGSKFADEMWARYRRFGQPTGVAWLGKGSKTETRLSVFDSPQAGGYLPFFVSNAPELDGFFLIGVPGAQASFFGAPLHLSQIVAVLPLRSDTHGKAALGFYLPKAPGLVFATQMLWVGGKSVNSSEAYLFKVCRSER